MNYINTKLSNNMVTVNNFRSKNPIPHNLNCVKPIGTFKPSVQNYNCNIMCCSNGDPRYMVFNWNNYAIATKEEIDEAFNEVIVLSPIL